MLQICKTQAEREKLIAELKEKHQNDNFDTTMRHLGQIKDGVKEISAEAKLLSLSDFGISLSHVSEQYLGKSRSYLSQRLHGNRVNGKRARLSDSEIRRISTGLRSTGVKLQELSDALVA